MRRSLCAGFVAVTSAWTVCLLGGGCGGGSSHAGEVISVAVSVTATTVLPGGNLQVTATVTNDSANRGVAWKVTCDAPQCGSVAPATTLSGAPATYTASGTPPVSTETDTITAMSLGDSTKTASATVTIAPISLSVSPQTATVAAGGTQKLIGTVSGDPANGGVNWSVSCDVGPCGTISPAKTASGAPTTYTAPSATPIGDLSAIVTAASASNAAALAQVVVTVPGLTVSVTPNPATVAAGTTVQFTATVVNDPSNSGVTWALTCQDPSGPPCGSVSPTTTPSGVPTTYTAPTDIPVGDVNATLTASSVAHPAALGASALTIPGLSISVASDISTVEAGATAQVIATVANDTLNKGVTWSLSCDPGPCGSIAPTTSASAAAVTYSAPAAAPSVDLDVTITATSVTNTGATGVLDLKIPAITVSVTPNSALLPAKVGLGFTATVQHDPAKQGVTWTASAPPGSTVCSPSCGSASPATTASGTPTTFTAPNAIPANQTVALNATSQTDTGKIASATITLTSGSVELVPNSLSFGTVVVRGNSKPQLVTLTNKGTAALTVQTVAIAGTNPGDFLQTNNCASSLGPEGSCTITVTFRPTGTMTRSAVMSITDTSTDSPQQVTLVGSGKQRPRIDAAMRSALTEEVVVTAPMPTGSDAVGTRMLTLTDSGRLDPYLMNGTKRELLVRFWYPAIPGQSCRLAEYTSPAVWSYFSRLAGVSLPQVKTNSCAEALVAPGVHPVVVFTPGYTATFTDYTFLFEDLASRGYVVASVDHTYEATAVEFPGGKFVESMMGSHLAKTLRGDDQSISFAVYVRIGDLRFVVNELARLNLRGNGPFAGSLDLSRIAVAGHSVGGMSAFLSAEHDSRWKSAVLLDTDVPPELAFATRKPMLVLNAGREKWTAGDCHLWASLQGPRLAVNLVGSEHIAASDAVWLARNAVATGNMRPEQTVAAVRDYVAAFLDAHLRGSAHEHLLSGSSTDYPDVVVTAANQPACGGH